ncbi:hypothetical protein DSM03_101448 [Leeuwenhoekiella aestuarii]|uniref:SnoaL-like protein n=1 Tax=Leeuwenhoekiella aestuarii TaxID=2249426 RepID=A0A4Q0NU98_9FLAO|nr:nuclear transport factor 2 family protein [Leeuwenhoekiella aestuarii]RXG14330.1 hypothetical protein DSM04_104439 [Leeuwenhoekiella aestuarii]RXG19079.1 hypothetical protein DSM03_101448 [Leeuwenhoekiella aestuarii]
MRSALVGSVLFLLFISCQSKETNQTYATSSQVDFKQVENLVQQVFDSIWSAKKATAISKYQTEDFLLLEHGAVWTNDSINDWCKRAAIRDQGIKRVNTFDFFEQKKEGARVWMAYHNYATFTKDDQVLGKGQWLESIVAVKKDSVWQLELMHSTRVPTTE